MNEGNTIRGYTDRQSVMQGGVICFCLARSDETQPARVPIRIIRLGISEIEMKSDVAVIESNYLSLRETWENNAWAVGYRLTVGLDWQSGVYAAELGAPAAASPRIYFVVTSARRETGAHIVTKIPTATINAYNNWGAASLYGYNSRPGPARAVSFNRPQQSDHSRWSRGYGFDEEWHARIDAFVRWMELAGYVTDYITDHDLHEDPLLADRYRLFISIGHDEYWSDEMRRNFDAFVERGGNAAMFSGNTCYWRIRFEPDELTGAPGRRLVCYKDMTEDPITDVAQKTVTWRETGRAENLSFGAGFARGTWKGGGKYGSYKVCRPQHWAFFATGLRENSTFGDDNGEPILGYETNGVEFYRDPQGLPIATGSDGTPASYIILALADLPDWSPPGNAAMGIITRDDIGGTVFNAATTDWARGLEACLADGDVGRTITSQITRNVIEHLTPMRFVCIKTRIPGGAESHVYRPMAAGSPCDPEAVSFKGFAHVVDSEVVPIYRFRAEPIPKERLSQSSGRDGWTKSEVGFYAYQTGAEDRVAVYRIQWRDPVNGQQERYSTSDSVMEHEIMDGIAFYAPK